MQQSWQLINMLGEVSGTAEWPPVILSVNMTWWICGGDEIPAKNNLMLYLKVITSLPLMLRNLSRISQFPKAPLSELVNRPL